MDDSIIIVDVVMVPLLKFTRMMSSFDLDLQVQYMSQHMNLMMIIDRCKRDIMYNKWWTITFLMVLLIYVITKLLFNLGNLFSTVIICIKRHKCLDDAW